MKRPFAVIGFTYLLVLASVSALRLQIVLCLLAAFLLLFLASILIIPLRKARIYPACFAAACIACCSFCLFSYLLVAPAVEMGGRNAEITGTVVEEPQAANGRYYYLVKTDSVSCGGRQEVKIRLSSRENLNAACFDRVRAQVYLYRPSELSSGESERYYRSQGIYLSAYVTGEASAEPLMGAKPLYYYAVKTRQFVRNAINGLLPEEEAAVALGLLIGDDSGLSADSADFVRKSGVSHVFAASGMHVSILLGAALWLFARLRIRKKLSYLLASFLILFFAAVAGFSPSILRAGIMYILYLLGQMLGKDRDSLNSLGFAVLCITVANPFAATDISLQLSFLATLGIILGAAPLYRWFLRRAPGPKKHGAKLYRGGMMIVATSLCASLFTLPVMIFRFGAVSLVAPLTNLLILPVVTFIFILTAAAAVLCAIGLKLLAAPLSWLIFFGSRYILAVCSCLAGIPYAFIPAGQLYVRLWVGLSLLLFALALFLNHRGRLLKFTAVLCAILLAVGTLSFHLASAKDVQIAVLQQENGYSAVLTRADRAIVIGCGGDGLPALAVQRQLQRNVVSELDAAVFPQMNDLYASGAEELLQGCPVRIVAAPEEGKYLRAAKRGAQENELWTASLSLQFWKDCTLETFPLDETRLIVRLAVGDTVLLFTPPGVDLALLPKEKQKADAVFCTGVEPENISLAQCATCVVSAEPSHVQMTASRLAARGVATLPAGETVYLKTNGTRLRLQNASWVQ